MKAQIIWSACNHMFIGFHSSDCSDHGIVGCDYMYHFRRVQTFQTNVLPSAESVCVGVDYVSRLLERGQSDQ
jgi:hypothetical protein